MKTQNRPKVTLYTDGSTWPGNPGHGGWGAALMDGEHVRALSGTSHQATNNQMETMAVLEGLRALKRPCHVTVVTDSMYVVNGMMALKKGRILKTNTHLWEAMKPLAARHTIDMLKVKGHADDPINEWVDSLAGAASAKSIIVDEYLPVPQKFIIRCEKRKERKGYAGC